MTLDIFGLYSYVGSCSIVVAMMSTSVCKAYWQLLLAQGVLMGLGNGLLFVTSISLLLHKTYIYIYPIND